MPYLSATLPLFAAIVSLCLGITVYYLSKGNIRRIFLQLCFITFYWQFSWVILFLSPYDEYANLICKIGYSGIIFLPLTFYETAAHYLDLDKKDISTLHNLFRISNQSLDNRSIYTGAPLLLVRLLSKGQYSAWRLPFDGSLSGCQKCGCSVQFPPKGNRSHKKDPVEILFSFQPGLFLFRP